MENFIFEDLGTEMKTLKDTFSKVNVEGK